MFRVLMEFIAPLSLLFTCAGMTVVYSTIEISDGWRVIVYFFGWRAFIIHWILRTLDFMCLRKLQVAQLSALVIERAL